MAPARLACAAVLLLVAANRCLDLSLGLPAGPLSRRRFGWRASPIERARSIRRERYDVALMRRRAVFVAVVALVALLAVAGPAFAGDNGEGLLGETDDKLITLFSLGVTAFFPLLALLLTVREHRHEKRKDARKQRAERERVTHRAA